VRIETISLARFDFGFYSHDVSPLFHRAASDLGLPDFEFDSNLSWNRAPPHGSLIS
jgi:hypothetical protein